ncbi:MAG TPA: hypothetical protein VFU47_17405, partial [Armatimonadota bacterium]|nr:hypothetical protein [Armatimonadota bacterium]
MSFRPGYLAALLLPAGLLPAPPARAQQAPPAAPPAGEAPRADEQQKPKNRYADNLGYPLTLDFHPTAYALPVGRLRFSSLSPLYPAGFRASDLSNYVTGGYGLADGWSGYAGVTGADRVGSPGTATFFGGGVKRRFVTETDSRPAIALGVYGMAGPHDHRSGNLYLTASKRVWSGKGHRALFLHGGLKLESFDGEDYGSGTGIRPFVGTAYSLNPWAYLSAEFSP